MTVCSLERSLTPATSCVGYYDVLLEYFENLFAVSSQNCTFATHLSFLSGVSAQVVSILSGITSLRQKFASFSTGCFSIAEKLRTTFSGLCVQLLHRIPSSLIFDPSSPNYLQATELQAFKSGFLNLFTDSFLQYFSIESEVVAFSIHLSSQAKLSEDQLNRGFIEVKKDKIFFAHYNAPSHVESIRVCLDLLFNLLKAKANQFRSIPF